MYACLEIVFSLLAVTGLLAIGWLCFGRLLRPMGGRDMLTLIPADGAGERLEQALVGLDWLRGAGLVEGQVILVDKGLTADGVELALQLTAREHGVYLCPYAELSECLAAMLERDEA